MAKGDETLDPDEKALARREGLIASVCPAHYIAEHGEGIGSIRDTVLRGRWLVTVTGCEEVLITGAKEAAERYLASMVWCRRWSRLRMGLEDLEDES